MTVLLVDDDPVTLRMLESKVPWADFGMTSIRTACGGAEALEIFAASRVDFAFVDMKMPRMSGVDLIRHGQSISPHTYFVVLSAYDDFELVKGAFQAGAVDYLLKSEILQEEFPSILTRLRYLSRQSLPRGNTAVKEWLSWSDEIAQMNGKYQISVFCLECEDPAVLDRVSREAGASRDTDHMVRYSMNGRVLLAVPSDCADAVVKTIEAESLRGTEGPERRVHVGTAHSTRSVPAAEIVERATRAAHAARFYDLPNHAYSESGWEPHRTEAEKRRLLQCIGALDFSGIGQVVDEILDEMKEQLVPGPRAAAEIADFFIYLFDHLLDVNLLPVSTSNITAEVIRQTSQIDTFRDLRDWCDEHLRRITQYYRLQCRDNLVTIIRSYVERDSANPEMSLKLISTKFGISGSYFSRRFCKETGVQFHSYLKHLRIEAAKRLIASTEKRLGEISELVGFVSFAHFSRAFKSLTGVSPSVYRSREGAVE